MIETVTAPAVTPPMGALPRGACDCHMHVFGPFDAFPPPDEPSYALPDTNPTLHLTTLDRLGLDRAILIQPSPYQTDHRALLHALANSPDRLRGIGSCDAGTSGETLQALRRAGIIGLRFVEMKAKDGGRYPGTQGLDSFDRLAADMRTHHMHAQLWADAASCADAAQRMAKQGMTLVLDHLAGLGPEDLPGSRNFDRIAEALDSGLLWIKLTYFRKSARPLDYGDMRPVVAALAEARPDRLLWGSDWPFVRMDGEQPDAGRLIGQLREWIGEDAFIRVVRDNPAMLFGW